MRLADPQSAARHYASALTRSPTRSAAAMNGHGNVAIALGSIGRFDEGRHHALQALAIASEVAAGWRHADALRCPRDRRDRRRPPLAALNAIDEALIVLGDIDHPMLRYQLAEHRTWALAMLGRVQAARQWLARTTSCGPSSRWSTPSTMQDLVATRARTLEAAGQLKDAMSARWAARAICRRPS